AYEPSQRPDDARVPELRRLQLHEAEVDPALAAAADHPDRLDDHEQGEHRGIGRVGGEQDKISREQPYDERHGEEDAVTHQVRSGIPFERSRSRRIEHRSPEADEQRQGDQHAPWQAFQRGGQDGYLHCASPPAVSEGGVMAWVATAAGWAAARASASTWRMIVARSEERR